MKIRRIAVFFAALATSGLLVSAPAWAGHGRVFIGMNWGWPGWPYYPFAQPYYGRYDPFYPPRTVVVERRVAPVVYVERDAEVSSAAVTPAPTTLAPAAASWYYYCAAEKKYYPYINACPSGWTRVPVNPPEMK